MSVPEDNWLTGPEDDPEDEPQTDDVAKLAAELAVELDLTARHLAFLSARHDRTIAMCRQLASRLKQNP